MATIFRWIREALVFLFVLAMLHLARLAVVLFCIAELAVILALWGVALAEWQKQYNGYWFLMPIGAMLLVIVQVSLWQFTWLRLAQRGGMWRALAEWFSRAVRYPVVRTPHTWE